MKILQINNRIPFPLNDGGNIATYKLTEYLQNSGNEVVFLTLNTKKHHQDPKVMEKICKIHAVDIDTKISPIKALKNLIFSKKPYNLERFWSTKFVKELEYILKKYQFDIIQIEGPYMGIYLDTIRQNSEAPVIMRAHNVEYKIWERLAKHEKNPLKKWYLRILAKRIKRFEVNVFPKFDAITSLTKDDAEQIRSLGFKKKIEAIPSGIEISPKQCTLKKEKSVGFLGSMEWFPNIQAVGWLVEKIAPEVEKLNKDITFHIAGKAMPDSWYNKQNQMLQFHGMVPNAQEFICSCDIFVVPLLSGSGMRIKVIEAMALGRCVVSTSVGAEGIKYTAGKDILIADTPEAIAKAIVHAIEDESLAKSIGKNAQETIQKNYSWKIIVEKMLEFYGEVIE